MIYDRRTRTSSRGDSSSPERLQELLGLLQKHIHLVTAFNDDEGSILSRLPESKFWRRELNGDARGVLFDEYEVEYLDELFDEAERQDAPPWWRAMRACGALICHTPEMNTVVEILLVKLDGLDVDDQRSLKRIVELVHECHVAHFRASSPVDELAVAVQALQGMPLWPSQNHGIH